MGKRNILITGGAGFIGSSLAHKLAEDTRNSITIVDNLLTGDIRRIPQLENVKFIKGDVNDNQVISSIFYGNKFDYVFHYAAVVGVKRTIENPIMVLDDLKGMRNVLDLCKNTSVKRVFFSSSSEVYGEPVELPQHEYTTPLNSRLPYAIVKNVGEAFLKSYKQEYDLNYTIFRFFNTYGPLQSKDFVVSRFISAALKGEDITIYGDGSQTRTFCFVDDNIQACVNAFMEDKIINDVVNIGSDKVYTVLELAQEIVKVSNSKSKIIHLPPLEEGDMSRRQPDTRKMLELLGREPRSLVEGLKKVIENPSFFL
ncbi:MAG: NAD-dependent epimerase/dehydratase family protein [Bacteroidetes bacterium]|nr:MAG: NAD-dependent epimerase/dehydratase family protein [Bacteroidota bacterium]MBL1143630.1 NAD-dependent epimerase/dehydratase family protein [Bacteroidota bacterium]MCB0803662.1 NAD-dependent epimerase/dehydratase family protein [Flavobacteriales bacterium]NOG56432.1 NAD-dependent epimerase/dehydratase family protein [Bacteroidota bacterium]